jgi:hypothetical protein
MMIRKTPAVVFIVISLLTLTSASLVGVMTNIPAYAQTATFGNPTNLSNNPLSSTHPTVAVSGSNVYMVWTEEPDAATGNIFLAISRDGGLNFGAPIDLSNNVGYSFLPTIAVSGSNVYVSWTRVTETSEIVIVTSTDGGLNFGSPVEVSSGDLFNSRFSSIGVAGSNIYVVWEDFSQSGDGSESDILFGLSTDGGATFSSPTDISNSPGTVSLHTEIAVLGNNLFVIWRDCDPSTGTNCRIMFTKSTDAGASFSTPIPINNPESDYADVDVIGNTVYVVWSSHAAGEIPNREVFLSTSLDGGTTFGTPMRLSNNPEEPAQSPRIDVDGSNIGITWLQRVSGTGTNPSTSHFDIMFIGSTDGGASFSSPVSVTDSMGELSSTLNEVALFGNNVYVGWTAFITDPVTTASSFDVFFLAGTLSPQVPTDNSPPTITINSAMDGYNIPITNQIGTTVSNTITFDFSVTDDVGVGSVTCSLDNNPVQCESTPVTYTVQSAGQHTFRIDAADTSNNPSSTQFLWTVLTLQEGIQQIIQTIDTMNLQQDVANSLKGPLHQAYTILTDKNPRNDGSACNKLVAFIQEQVNYYQGTGQLTQEQASLLTQQAQTIRLALGC